MTPNSSEQNIGNGRGFGFGYAHGFGHEFRMEGFSEVWRLGAA